MVMTPEGIDRGSHVATGFATEFQMTGIKTE